MYVQYTSFSYLQTSTSALLLVRGAVRDVSMVMDPSSVSASVAINWRWMGQHAQVGPTVMTLDDSSTVCHVVMLFVVVLLLQMLTSVRKTATIVHLHV